MIKHPNITLKWHYFLSVVLLTGCANENATIERAAIYFEPVPDSRTGITFSNDLHHTNDLNIIEYLYYYNGGGVAVGDINNDGLEDIYLSANQKPDKLYLNLGDLQFRDITEQAGLKVDSTWSTGVTMEDVNNDGLLDIYVSKVSGYKGLTGHNLLYINKGNNSFEEASTSYGLNFSGLSTQGVFFDYDNDGDMDLYQMNHSIHTPRSYGTVDLRLEKDVLAGDRLYENQLNEGKPSFVDVTEKSGIYSSALGYGLALAASDINDDGWMDIYVGNDFHENDYLYINNGDATFKESSKDYFGHTTRFTMGVDIADLNNDGLLDVFTLDMMPFDKEILMKSAGEDTDKVAQIKLNYGFNNQYARNVMQLNKGDETFFDVALMTKTYASDWSWSSLIQDYDNDGLSDIYITNGIFKRPNDLNYINLLSNSNMSKYSQTKQDEVEKKLIDEMPTINIPNVVYRNKGNMEYEMLTEKAGMQPSYSNGAAYSDLDNDGDLDIITNNINQKAQILENISDTDKKHNYVSFSLKGDAILKNPLGSSISLYGNGKHYLKELIVVKGFQSSSSRKLHFGLGPISTIDSVQIKWTDGTFQVLKGVDPNQHYTISKNSNALIERIEDEIVPQKKSILEPFPFVHLENNYLDYDREGLMPEKLSTEGPALVVADFNNDGIMDIYVGGAKYQSSGLFIGKADGSFTISKEGDLARDAIYEDVDATVLDIDNDGDLDLYVMSGGNEIIEGSDYLEDRIYINDGKALFKRLPLDLIKTNGGSISAADFNGDGYDDLFIGNRSIPGGYGLSPNSYILENNGDGQYNIIEQQRMGMVTDSQWEDLNNDGYLDLVVVGDWMPITVYLNQGDNTFKNATQELGLQHSHGFWNSVTVADLDHDGKKDILAGNAGLNSKWQASVENPVKLYLDDFDGNEQLDPIIFYTFFGNYVPFASKDKLVGQLPMLKKRYFDYEKFSGVSGIEDLIGIEEKDVLETKKVTELRSMVYLQKEKEFKAVPLPKKAQISSIEDIFFDAASNQIIFVGNYLDYVTELGQSNASTGGIVKMDDIGNISFINFLDLPARLNARKIEPIDENRFIVVSNNDQTYLLDLTNKTVKE